MKNRHWLPRLGRYLPILILALTLGVTGVAKLFSFGDFQASLAASQLVPSGFEGFAGSIFIAVELLIAVLVLLPKTQPLAFRGAILLGSLLFGYQVWRWFGGIVAPCACLGKLYNLSPVQSFLMTGLLLTSAVVGVRGTMPAQIVHQPVRRSAFAFGLSIALLAALFQFGPPPAHAGNDPGTGKLGSCTGTGCDNANQCVGNKWKVWDGLDRCTWGTGSCQNDKDRLCYTLYATTKRGCRGDILYPGSEVEEKACR